ncbi:hypothetical protein SAMN05660359_02788 [Geodermatophilus obscurus]|uniref:Lipoprotein n=1 Tax=Geodermatophilus obscurus TaxID=1861 RepID=A0A1I5GDG3_9ACTN|nr:hypothetical protein [Geodermatophilus obscurus]SFO34014.1 hypothetical protein SAMN05660359_02788 [Geodermatophilus obscurus]
MRPTDPTARRALAGVLLGATLLLSACGAREADDLAAAGAGDALGADVPEECTAPFPLAVGTADVADLDSVPAGFPDAPAGSVLCETGRAADGGQEYANYASDLPAEEVLAYYGSSAPEARRSLTGLGRPAVSGTLGGVFWQVEPVDGGFRLVLAPGADLA